ncbi:hypothetical protein OR16_17027 [Cupriavidus basilensis OR16]|uniref:Uncharacterized protein n=1 Tax=Cupriavidus basilensis OR16 TaxID=1127483 RepID=H1S695_9BURK|nr:hypothetical protein OR16_17027 [Cupriavidus basilensis OR16]
MLLLQAEQRAAQELHRNIERHVLRWLQVAEEPRAFWQLPAPRSINTQPLPARAAMAGANAEKTEASVRVG